MPILAATIALFAGAGLGSSGSQEQIRELEEGKSALESRVVTLEESETSAVSELKVVEEKRADLVGQFDDRGEKIKKLEEQVKTLKSKSTDLEGQVADLEGKIGDLETQLVSAQQAVESANASGPTQFAAEAPPASTYFKNCSEARAAGAAPVYAGDPGYGSHLDRDGDGVGCE